MSSGNQHESPDVLLRDLRESALGMVGAIDEALGMADEHECRAHACRRRVAEMQAEIDRLSKFEKREHCPECAGTGRRVWFYEKGVEVASQCASCNGSGRLVSVSPPLGAE